MLTAVFLLGGRAAELPGDSSALIATSSLYRLVVDISMDYRKPLLVKAAVIKPDCLTDQGVPVLSSKSERGSNDAQSRGIRCRWSVAGRRSDRITDLGYFRGPSTQQKNGHKHSKPPLDSIKIDVKTSLPPV